MEETEYEKRYFCNQEDDVEHDNPEWDDSSFAEYDED